MPSTRHLAALAAVALLTTGCEPTNALPVPAVSFSATPASPGPASSGPVSPRPGAEGSPDSFAEGTQPSPPPGAPGRLATVAAIDWLDLPDTGHFGVTFHLTENCAYLQGPPDKPIPLAWPHGHAWIDEADPDTVQLREPASGKLTRITDGQRVNLGGIPVGGLSYVTPPHASCPTGEAFLVTQIM